MRDKIAPSVPPHPLMAVLAFGLGKWLKSPNSVEWHYGLPLTLIMNHVIKELTAFIIDDPYGDYRKLYADHMGNDIKMPIDDILKYIKDISDKHNKDIIIFAVKAVNDFYINFVLTGFVANKRRCGNKGLFLFLFSFSL